MVLGLCIVVHSILLLVYYLRTQIYIKYFFKQNILPTSHSISLEQSSTSTININNNNNNNKISMVFGHENKVFDLASELKNNSNK